MADAADRLAELTTIQLVLAFLGTALVVVALLYTRQTARAGIDAANAANRQANIAVALEAAKIVVSNVEFERHDGGGGYAIMAHGPPQTGWALFFQVKNIGKTRAFPTKSAVAFRISKKPPPFKYGLGEEYFWDEGPGITGLFGLVPSKPSLEMSFEEQIRVKNREMSVWVIGSIWFDDWFRNPHEEHFLYEWDWKSAFKPNGPATAHFKRHAHGPKKT